MVIHMEPAGGNDVTRRVRWWVRAAGVLMSVCVTILVSLLLAWDGTASASHGWLLAAAVLLPGLLLGAIAVGLGRWYMAVAYSLGLALLVGGWMYRTSPPTHERIESVAVQVGIPEGWDRVTGEVTGSTWCLGGACPEIRYVYATADSDVETRRDLTVLLQANGWDKDDASATWQDDPENYQDWHKGRWHVTLNIRPVGAKGREYDTATPQDLTQVSLLYRG